MSGALDAEVRVARGGFAVRVGLAVPDGAVLAVMGRNGAGKSTLLAAIAGLLPVDGGRVVVDGAVLDDPSAGVFVQPERRPIGTVLQQPALFPHLSVRDNVAFGLRTGGLGRREARRRAEDLLDRAGLGALAARRPAQVSGGQAARVGLVRTLAREPALLLLDEPLAAVDAEQRPELRDTLRASLDAFAGSAVLVTHDVRDTAALASHVVVLDAGAVVQRGTLAELRARPAAPIVERLLDPQASRTSPA